MDSSAAPPPTTPPPAAPCSMSPAPPSFLSDEVEVARVPRLLERRGIEDCAAAMSSSAAGVMAPRDGSTCEGLWELDPDEVVKGEISYPES